MIVILTVTDRGSLTGFRHVVDKGIVGKFRVVGERDHRTAIICHVAFKGIVGEIDLSGNIVNIDRAAVCGSLRSGCGSVVLLKNIVVKSDRHITVVPGNRHRTANL